MANHTIDLSAERERRLAIIVAEYNARNQSSLTLDAWLQLHVREMAIGRDLAASVATLTEQSQRQAEADLNAAAAAEKGAAVGSRVVTSTIRPGRVHKPRRR